MIRWVRLAATTTLLLATYFLVPVRPDPSLDALLRGLGAVVLLATAAGFSLRQVRRSLAGTSARIDGLVLALIGSVVAFALVAYALEVHRPAEFDGLSTRLDSLYFTMATLLTVGYGDVHAAGQAARALVVVQMVFDVVVVAATVSALTAQLRQQVQGRGRDGGMGS